MKKCLSILGFTGRFIKYSLNKNSNECHDDIKTFWKWFKSLIQLLSNKSDINLIQITKSYIIFQCTNYLFVLPCKINMNTIIFGNGKRSWTFWSVSIFMVLKESCPSIRENFLHNFKNDNNKLFGEPHKTLITTFDEM